MSGSRRRSLWEGRIYGWGGIIHIRTYRTTMELLRHPYRGEVDRHEAALSSAGNLNKCLCCFKGTRAESHNKQRECVCACPCAYEQKREGGREKAEREIKAGDMLLNVCVGGEASPTQSALPHSLQPTQVFRSITSLCSRLQLFISHLQLFSKQSLGTNQQPSSDLCDT